MPSQPPTDDDYTWLYGETRKPTPPASPADPEPTQVIPTRARPGAPAPSGGPASGESPHPIEIAPEPGRDRRGRASTAPTPRAERPRRSGRGVWRAVKVALLLWVVFLVAVPIWAFGRIERVEAFPGGTRPADQPGTTYLLVGSDSRKGLSKAERRRLGTGNAAGRRTDTIMLLHTGSRKPMLISIPRDSLVPIPGHGTTKINAAFAYGGPTLLVETVEKNTGVRIDHYVEIGFGGFVKAVDAVGGIRVCTPTRLEDKLANLHMTKGCHDVDGAVALAYARSRHTQADGDLGRARHQREVVSKVGAKVKSPWTVINPLRYYGLADAGSSSLRISDGSGPISLANFALAMTGARSCGMPISDMAVHWDPVRSKKLLALIKEDRTDQAGPDLCTGNGLPR